jgi:endonuclease YncB( thermonuclease family)
MRLWRSPAPFLLTLLFAHAIHADTFSGKVVRVLDGDTVEILDIETNVRRIRLAGIDAPEIWQELRIELVRYSLEHQR